MAIVIFLVSLLSFSLLLCWMLKRRPADPHGVRPYPVLGHLPQFLKNRDRFHDWMTDILAATPTNTIVFHRPGGVRGIITANPSNVEHILRASFDNYPKGPRFRTILHDFLGRGIFNADGPLWRAQRKTASHEFNTRSLRTFALSTARHETLSRLLPLLQTHSAAAAVLDLQDVLERFAFDNICKVAFGVDPACLAPGPAQGLSPGFAEAFKDAANLSAGRFRYSVPRFWKVTRLLNLGSERRLKEAIATVNEFALQIIRARKKEMQSAGLSPAADDLLSRFISGEDDSDEFLRDIVISFLLAGRDTTSSALTWFFWLLSSRPDVENNILDEIRSIRERGSGGNGGEFEFDELREMQCLHAAITESMRLYPPVPTNTTACLADDVLPDGTEVRRGWFTSYSAYAMGRMDVTSQDQAAAEASAPSQDQSAAEASAPSQDQSTAESSAPSQDQSAAESSATSQAAESSATSQDEAAAEPSVTSQDEAAAEPSVTSQGEAAAEPITTAVKEGLRRSSRVRQFNKHLASDFEL